MPMIIKLLSVYIKVRFDRKGQGVEWREGGHEGGRSPLAGRGLCYLALCPIAQEFFAFSSKKCRFLCIFIAKNNLWTETGTGGLNRPPGAEVVKRTEG